jgi:hypothetical protein
MVCASSRRDNDAVSTEKPDSAVGGMSLVLERNKIESVSEANAR